jgi:hypothetical protein
VSKGPLAHEYLEALLETEVQAAHALLKSKVGIFTSEEKIQELVVSELGPSLETIRDVNALWADGKAAMESFRFAESLSKFETAAMRLRSDWWGTRAAEKADAVAAEMTRLRKLKEDADNKMVTAGRLRTSFHFLEAASWYRQALPNYAQVPWEYRVSFLRCSAERCACYITYISSYTCMNAHPRTHTHTHTHTQWQVGNVAKFAEVSFRIQEMDEKARLKAEADEKLEHSGVLVAEYAPTPPQGEGDVPFPPTKLQIAEATVLLEDCVRIYAGYDDEAMRKRAQRRLEAAKWALERQTKAYAMVRTARDLSYKYAADKTVAYKPTTEYHFGAIFHKLRAGDAVEDLELAANLFGDAKDGVNQALCASLVADARDRAMHTNMARIALEEAQVAESKYTYDVKLKPIIVFGGTPLREKDPPRQPYVRHAIASDYPLRDETAGVQFHRLMLEESTAAYAKAKRIFELAGDVHNTQEAARREDATTERRKVQHEAYELIKEGQACIRSRQYAAGYDKYVQAASRLHREAQDEVNASYVDQLVADAAAKCTLAQEASKLMSDAKELVARKDTFERWEDVVSIGLAAFTEAEKMYARAAQLYGELDDEGAKRSAADAQKDAEERKVRVGV